jgi:hypothetical protein
MNELISSGQKTDVVSSYNIIFFLQPMEEKKLIQVSSVSDYCLNVRIDVFDVKLKHDT